MVIKSLSKNISKKASYLIATVIIFSIVLLQTSSRVEEQKPISPSEMKIAKDSVKNVMDKLASYRTFVEFTFTAEDLDAISKLTTHLLPNTRVVVTTSRYGLSLSISTKINLFAEFYINNHCLLINNGDGAVFEECKLGNLPVHGFLVKWLINSVVYLVMGEEVSNTTNDLLVSAQHNQNSLLLKAKKSKFFKEEVNESISKVGDLATLYTQSSNVPPEVVQIYIDEISLVHASDLNDYLKPLFSLAAQRSVNGNAVDENAAIIWALAVTFGDYRFASLIGMKRNMGNKKVPLLRGRDDLTKHFIYSAALQQLGGVQIGLSIGEAKELLDSISGGSGFSFADLAADKAGLKFAEYITSNNDNAEQAQVLFKRSEDENYFFPFVRDLPEDQSNIDFIRIYKDIDSLIYKETIKKIDKQISKLRLYNH